MRRQTLRIAFAVAAVLTAVTSQAQTVISNETLVSTTFVVSKDIVTAKCFRAYCHAKANILSGIQVACPAAIGQTCTFQISLDTKASVGLPCPNGCSGAAPTSFFQFLVDGAAPTIGPTNEDGNYIFATNVRTQVPGSSRQSYPATVLAGVTNSTSNNHTIAFGLGCRDDLDYGGCQTTSYWSTMRVDVFEP